VKEPENGPVHPKSISFTSYEIVEQGIGQDVGDWWRIDVEGNTDEGYAIPEGRDPV
jgi:hypothetical protein